MAPTGESQLNEWSLLFGLVDKSNIYNIGCSSINCKSNCMVVNIVQNHAQRRTKDNHDSMFQHATQKNSLFFWGGGLHVLQNRLGNFLCRKIYRE